MKAYCIPLLLLLLTGIAHCLPSHLIHPLQQAFPPTSSPSAPHLSPSHSSSTTTASTQSSSSSSTTITSAAHSPTALSALPHLIHKQVQSIKSLLLEFPPNPKKILDVAIAHSQSIVPPASKSSESLCWHVDLQASLAKLISLSQSSSYPPTTTQSHLLLEQLITYHSHLLIQINMDPWYLLHDAFGSGSNISPACDKKFMKQAIAPYLTHSILTYAPHLPILWTDFHIGLPYSPVILPSLIHVATHLASLSPHPSSSNLSSLNIFLTAIRLLEASLLSVKTYAEKHKKSMSHLLSISSRSLVYIRHVKSSIERLHSTQLDNSPDSLDRSSSSDSIHPSILRDVEDLLDGAIMHLLVCLSHKDIRSPETHLKHAILSLSGLKHPFNPPFPPDLLSSLKLDLNKRIEWFREQRAIVVDQGMWRSTRRFLSRFPDDLYSTEVAQLDRVIQSPHVWKGSAMSSRDTAWAYLPHDLFYMLYLLKYLDLNDSHPHFTPTHPSHPKTIPARHNILLSYISKRIMYWDTTQPDWIGHDLKKDKPSRKALHDLPVRISRWISRPILTPEEARLLSSQGKDLKPYTNDLDIMRKESLSLLQHSILSILSNADPSGKNRRKSSTDKLLLRHLFHHRSFPSRSHSVPPLNPPSSSHKSFLSHT
ncbi:MAG: hypothetical protein DHS80DRAFT_28987 [Piptocephalis tieghemiana]|nr:MAG: hypothetical protein DHS80DRAFT_28987 [Piptocephalis tieghemiana]